MKTTMEMIRTFHPVGQGAFYSEKFETRSGDTFTIVYDCGSDALNKNQNKREREKVEAKIKTAFPKDSQIDILFISHFHADHINGIELLKNHYKEITTVILPELTPEAKILLKIEYFLENDPFDKPSYEKFEQLIDNPVSFFGEERVQIITIKPVDEESRFNDEQLSEPINISEVTGNKTFPSGTNFSHSQVEHWFFIPFNYKQEERRKQLEGAIAAKGIKLESLNDIDAIIEQKQPLKEAYESIYRNLNVTSMILYSGPLPQDSSSCFPQIYIQTSCFRGHLYPYDHLWDDFHRGCLYTGDISLKAKDIIADISDRLKNFLQSIGTLQIPHHGSIHNFEKSILQLGHIRYAIFSFGSNNTYGHPSDFVVEEVVKEGVLPCLITEDPSSIVVQHIRFYP